MTTLRAPQLVRDRFLQLRAEGASYDRISQELKISKHTLIDWGRQYADTIAGLQAIHLESLAAEFQLVRRHRVELLGRQLQAVRDELATRRLKDVPTPRLLDMLLKLTKTLAKELPEPEQLFTEPPAELLDDSRADFLPGQPLPEPSGMSADPSDEPPADAPTEPTASFDALADPADDPVAAKDPAANPADPPAPARTKTAPVSGYLSGMQDLRTQPGMLQELNARLTAQDRALRATLRYPTPPTLAR